MTDDREEDARAQDQIDQSDARRGSREMDEAHEEMRDYARAVVAALRGCAQRYRMLDADDLYEILWDCMECKSTWE